MPRLVKGGKWVYGWAVISPERKVLIPPEAWQEYGFQVGDKIFFLRGSRRSGGFGISKPERMAESSEQLVLRNRALGQGYLDQDGSVTLPPEVEAKPGDCLLTARGSRLALAFVARGPIYEEAVKHPELAELSWGSSR